MSVSIKLETPRLIIRHFQDNDIKILLAYRNDPEIAKYQSWNLPYSEIAAQEFIEYLQQTTPGTLGEWYQLAVELKATGEMIGDCAFCILAEDGQQAEIGFTLIRPHQGQGYATEAVKSLLEYLFVNYHLHRIRANCDPENIASVKLLERLGMRLEGHFMKSLWLKGKWVDELWFAILRAEFFPSSELM
jgi:aminoglycoside 6'-N-acetyltransferase